MLQGRFHELLREVFRSRHPALANILLRAGTQHSDGDCHEFIRLRQLGANRHETLTASARPGLAKLCMGNLQGAPLGSRRHSNNSSFEISFRQQELQSSFPYKVQGGRSGAPASGREPFCPARLVRFFRRHGMDANSGKSWPKMDLRTSGHPSTLATPSRTRQACSAGTNTRTIRTTPDGEVGQQAFAEEHIQACSTFIADIVPIVCDGCVQQRKPIAH